MELLRGMRVGLGTNQAETCIAVVLQVAGDRMELELLDPFDSPDPDDAFTVFAPSSDGLYCWPGIADGEPAPDRLWVKLGHGGQLVQRRRGPRYEVDLRADVRRMGFSGLSRPQPVRIVDLSHGGAKIVGRDTLETGDSVVVYLDLGRGASTVAGRVAMAYSDGATGRICHIAFGTTTEPSPGIADIDDYLRTLETRESLASGRAV